MTWGEFSKQMDKISAQFGSQHYGPERMKLIFREAAWLSAESWQRVCEYMIGESRFAPTLSEIREQIIKEREKIHEADKREHRRDANEFWEAVSGEDSDFFFGNVKKRIRGEISDSDFDLFMRALQNFRRR